MRFDLGFAHYWWAVAFPLISPFVWWWTPV